MRQRPWLEAGQQYKVFAERAAAEGTSAIKMGFGACTNKHHLVKWIARGIACWYTVINDRAVMHAYGMPVKGTTESFCVAELMRRYQEMVERT